MIELAWPFIGRCAICNKIKFLFYITPADPPFYPAEGGHHCRSCERWLQEG